MGVIVMVSCIKCTLVYVVVSFPLLLLYMANETFHDVVTPLGN